MTLDRIQLIKWRDEFAELVIAHGNDQMAAGIAAMNRGEDDKGRATALSKCKESFKAVLDRIYDARPASRRQS